MNNEDSLEPCPKLTYSIKVRGDIVKIYINGMIHQFFEKSNIDFIVTSQSNFLWWKIKFVLKTGNKVTVTYDNLPKFENIMKKLDMLHKK